jgi:YihY family inner membrane protein
MHREFQTLRTSRLRRVWTIIWLALCKYSETDGEQRAASFAYYAFFALFPLILLFISMASMFVHDPAAAASAIIDFVDDYIPVSPGEENIVTVTINGVLKSRSGAGIVAILGLMWSALRFFQALVRGVNKAWGTHEYPWWRLPFKNAAMVGIVASALLLGILAPTIMKYVEWYYWQLAFGFGAQVMVIVFRVAKWLLSTLVLFYGFSMFFKFAPRRRTLFSEVWVASLFVTFSLQLLQSLFVLYVVSFAHFNRLYGTFGSVVALLMWIYLSGSIIILGGCLCAAQAEAAGKVQHEVETKS